MHDHDMVHGESSPLEYVKFGLVLSTVLLLSIALNFKFGHSGWQDYSRWFMGVFFVVFAGFKFAGYSMFAMMFAGYDVVAKRFRVYAYAYPFIELGLGVLYVVNVLPLARDIATVIVMGVSLVGVTHEIKKRSGVHCACLGNIIKLPLSTVSLVEDAGMGLMAVAMLLLR